MNALELLKEDHKKVSELFAQVEATEGEEKHKQLFEKIKTELETHTHIEEKIFYPALETEKELKDIVLEAYEEHKQVKTLLREIERLSDDSERFDAKLKVLIESVEHHVEEEEGEMFPKVKQLLDASELDRLGQEMDAEKTQFRRQHRSISTGTRR